MLAYVSWGSLASRRIDQNSVKDCIRSLRGNRLFKIPRRRRPRKRRLKSEFACFQSPSRILQLIYFVKLQGNPFWAEFLRTILSSERERKFSRRFLTSSIKGEIRHFPVYREVTVKKCTKKLDARAELLFCPFNLLLFWRFSLSSPSWHLKVLIVSPNQYACTVGQATC